MPRGDLSLVFATSLKVYFILGNVANVLRGKRNMTSLIMWI
jgi:hypothetical protein